jgi:hypothetical protein
MEAPEWLSASELSAWEDFLAASTLTTRQIEQQLKDDAGLSHPSTRSWPGCPMLPVASCG